MNLPFIFLAILIVFLNISLYFMDKRFSRSIDFLFDGYFEHEKEIFELKLKSLENCKIEDK